MNKMNDWEQFEKLLKNHDWYSAYSDDYCDVKRGQAEYSVITALYSKLQCEDKQRADEMFGKYSPFAKK